MVTDLLTNKVALVTGGGTGIGKAIALALAGRGANVAVNYSRSHDDAESTAEAIRELARRAITVKADVSREQDVNKMVDRVMLALGRLDILINNAGTTTFVDHKDLDGLSEEIWNQAFSVNIKGTFFCCRAAARVMTEGRIINIGSAAGIRGTGSSIAYAASKAAVHTMTLSLARVLAPRITVNAIAPGLIRTRWLAGHEAATNPTFADSLPAKRLGRPEDIAHIAVALASADDFLTGQIIVIDGGRLL